MKIYDYYGKKYSSRLVISKKPFGLGISFKLNPPFGMTEIKYSLEVDLIFIRFWIDALKKPIKP